MKLFRKISAVIAVLVIGAAVFIVMNLDRGLKAAIEQLGPEMTKTSVSLDKVSLSLMSGKGSLQGLAIGNPTGYKTSDAFSLGDISFALDTDSLKSDTIIVDSLHIIAPEVTMESGKKRSNLEQIQRNVESYLGSSGSTESSPQQSQQKLIVRDLQINQGQVHYSNVLLGDKTIDIALPNIALKNLGEKEGGASPSEIAGMIIDAITRNAGNAVAASDAVKQIGGQLEDQIKSKGEELKQKADNVKGLLDSFKKKD